MSDWRSRTRANIVLVSPDGDSFTAYWADDERTKEKKLGVFEYPNFDGTRVQDLGVQSYRYDMTFFFAGKNNDLEAERFASSCDQRGLWTVTHPVKGEINLQLVSMKEVTSPVNSGNITEFSCQWIEPITTSEGLTNTQLGQMVGSDVTETNALSAADYDDNISISSAADKIGAVESIEDVVAIVSDALSDLADQVDEVSSTFNSIQRSIQATLDAVIFQPLTIAGQVQQLIQLPALAIRDIETRVDRYAQLTNSLIDSLPGGRRQRDKNSLSGAEIALTSCVAATATSIVTGELSTRPAAIELIEAMTDIFGRVTGALEQRQSDFLDGPISVQFFSQKNTFNSLRNLVATVNAYILNSYVSLQIEKRITLDRDRSPVEITVSEYGSLGEDDENYSFFLSTNGLKKEDILLLPTGREVLVYV